MAGVEVGRENLLVTGFKQMKTCLLYHSGTHLIGEQKRKNEMCAVAILTTFGKAPS
jgi:hypothetical protein